MYSIQQVILHSTIDGRNKIIQPKWAHEQLHTEGAQEVINRRDNLWIPLAQQCLQMMEATPQPELVGMDQMAFL
jgi:hypothetical protein